MVCVYIYTHMLGSPSKKDASHHQDDGISAGNPYKLLCATVAGWGVDPIYTVDGIYLYIYISRMILIIRLITNHNDDNTNDSDKNDSNDNDIYIYILYFIIV